MLRIYLCDISHMRVATSLSGLLSRQLAASSGTEMKDAEQDTRNHGRIHAKQQRLFETIPTGASFLVELDTAIGATKSAGWL